MRQRRFVWTTAAVAVAVMALNHGARAQESAASSAGTAPPPATAPASAGSAESSEGRVIFSADVVIDESLVDDRGLVERRPQTRYRVSRRRLGTGVETEIVHPQARLFPKGPLTDPRSGYRYVFDDQLANPRIYDPSGKLVTLPATLEPPSASGAPAPGSGVVFSDRRLRNRKNDLVRRFGPAVGRQGGCDRYLSHDGDVTTETLVEPSSMLPVEVNVVRGGALDHRMAFGYARMPGGRWYLAVTRSESALPGNTGRRFVSQRTHTNVVSTEEQ